MNMKRKRTLRRHPELAAAVADRKAAPGPKPLRERKHLSRWAVKPTWPATADQRKQSRPVIVMRPVRLACMRASSHPVVQYRIRMLGARLPKHTLDSGLI